MKIILKTSVLLCSIIFAAAASAQMPQMSKHAQRNIQCTGCHQNGKFAPVPTAQCVTCHNQDQLAKSTERLNYTSRMKKPNPSEFKEQIAIVNPNDS